VAPVGAAPVGAAPVGAAPVGAAPVGAALVVAALVVAALAAVALDAAPVVADPTVARFTIDSGGGTSSGGAWSLSGTIGQPEPGTLSGGSFALAGGFWLGGSAVSGVAEDEPPADQRWVTAISPVAPNPMRDQATLTFRLARPEVVTLEIYSVEGKRVRTLIREPRPAGSYRLAWDGSDESGADVSSGLYFVRFSTGARHEEQKLILVR